ncbi:hypothetical protein E6C76_10905 [Pseudothauera nasutitermitis]|uniref:TadE-like protein n=1 Tax=Pseudothauera nasutitermitis TaxID=2565930 RepID=A0A4S4AY46_9RHOO|nr:hypothetical protein [Pseudothauera nasutitermitis]THF64566.1 hypothetical protein E6C76_10905 [Pseudothauera nasutitermitis]
MATLRTTIAFPACGPQRGQALTEFLVVALALIPLFLLIPIIAKYQDVAHATQMAARYAAFDATVRNDAAAGGWKSESELADEIRRRFFGASDAPIKTGDVAGEFDAHRNLFWRGPDGNPLLDDFSRVTVSFGPGHGSTHGDAFEAVNDMTSFQLLAGGLGLGSRGIYTANVSVALADLPAGLAFYRPFDEIGIVMTRSASLLPDPWTAKDAEEVEERILRSATVFPAGNLRGVAGIVNGFVSVIEWPAGLSGPKLGELEFWRDVVPEDRLEAD